MLLAGAVLIGSVLDIEAAAGEVLLLSDDGLVGSVPPKGEMDVAYTNPWAGALVPALDASALLDSPAWPPWKAPSCSNMP